MATTKKPVDSLNFLPFAVNESMISMILGAVVVILVGLLAYNYFRAQKSTQVSQTPSTKVTNETQLGAVGQAQNAVSLPTTHTVTVGENLWGIAEQYYKSGYNFVDIAKVNNLPNYNQIEVGQKLTIPKVEVRLPLTMTNATAPVVTENRITGGSYTVIKGDDLWNIAQRAYSDGYKWIDIAKANKLVNPSLIHPGNVLVLPR